MPTRDAAEIVKALNAEIWLLSASSPGVSLTVRNISGMSRICTAPVITPNAMPAMRSRAATTHQYQ